jgi:hypothetical protein
MSYAIAFDVELDRLVPDAAPAGALVSPWSAEGAPHITCAAVFSAAEGARYYFTRGADGAPAARMACVDAARLIDDLWRHAERHALIVSWGGTAVDFRALHAALDGDALRQLKCLQLVGGHVDIPIASATDTGMMMGLDAAAQGMRQGRKCSGASVDAPSMWLAGQHERVLQHVQRDAQLTLAVYEAVLAHAPPRLVWPTRRGQLRTWWCSTVPDAERGALRLRSVAECMLLPLPPTPFAPAPGMNRDVAVSWIPAACCALGGAPQ